MIFMFIFGGLAILVTGVTVDPLALRHRLSPGLPLSLRQEMILEKQTSLLFHRLAEKYKLSRVDSISRRPGNPSHWCDGRPIGFASPAFAGFAFIRFLMSNIL
jgi:hypothetical protein